MKYGLITFKNTQNIGDDIQSYAAIKFLPQIDYYIEREAMNEFVPEKNEIVTTIMNGWYLHDITSMPPSPFLNTLITSIHFTNHLEDKCPEYLDGLFIEYLKQKQPIGCRDNLVRKYLDEKNIKNFFSGCLTLTIDKFEEIQKEDYICAVDVEDEIVNKLKKNGKRVVELTHKLDVNENSKLTYIERMNNVENLLKKYQSAKLVITSRLHCVLPCLALETPVLYIHNKEDIDVKNRLGDYLKLLNYITKDELISKNDKEFVEFISAIKNKKEYLVYRESLEKQVSAFIESSKKENKLLDVDIDMYNKYFVRQKQYLINNLNYQKNKIEQYQNELIDYNNKLKKYNNELIEYNEELLKESESDRTELRKLTLQLKAAEEENQYMKKNIQNLNKKMNRMKNSKTWKIVRKVAKVKKVFRRKK